MRKLYIVLTLLMSSFFFLSSDVSASEITINVLEEEMDYLKTEEFLLLREKTIEHCNENNKSYIIYKYDSQTLVSGVFDTTNLQLKSNSSLIFLSPKVSGTLYYINKDGNFVAYGGGYIQPTFNNSNSFPYHVFLDTNVENINSSVSSNLIITYKDFSHTVSNGDHFPTLYELSLIFNPPEEKNPKLELISNFYILSIDKIKLLTDYIATDYIILSALVIFIFVAVIGLVRRLE